MIDSHSDSQSSCSKVGHVTSTHIALTKISDVSKSDVNSARNIILLHRQTQQMGIANILAIPESIRIHERKIECKEK